MEKIIEDKIYLDWHEALMENAAACEAYRKKRGYKMATLIKFRIGFDKKSGRYTIPIITEMGHCVDIRKYKIKTTGEEPKICSYKQGYGGARLYPGNLEIKGQVVICEGEHDAIMLSQQGFTAVSNTCGASCWRAEWSALFADCDAVIAYDCDKAGAAGAEKVRKALFDQARSIRTVNLGLGEKEDVTDYFVKHKHTPEDFQALINSVQADDPFAAMTVHEAIDGKNCGKAMKFSAAVVGKQLSPYQVPLKVKIKCTGSGRGRGCEFCNAFEDGKDEIEKTYTFEKDQEWLTKFVNCSDTQLTGYIRQSCGIPSREACRSLRIEIVQRSNIEDAVIIPEVSYDRQDQPYSLHRVLFLGGNLDTNRTYLLRGTSLPDPHTQQGLFIIKEAHGTKDNISKFRMTAEVVEQLKKLQPVEGQTIEDKVNHICDNLAQNVTKIYGRRNLTLAALLTYHSALRFNFLGNAVQKGWLECACIGDTETGKTETIKNLVYHIQAGEFITSGENTTLAGILGGLQPTQNGGWTITWGKLPLNDRGLLAIDEMENIARKGFLGHLSGVRSSGIAELIKVQTQRTMARTRIIWIANPLNGRMRDYNYAIQSIKEIFGEQQDIRRVDFVVGAKKEEISDKDINKRHIKEEELVYTSEMMHSSVLRAWNMPPENVKFDEAAENEILEWSVRLGKEYCTEIPLMLGTGGRLKLARMAVALAMLLFSTTDGQDVIVKKEHVSFIVDYIQALYNTDVLAYADFSRLQNREFEFDKFPFLRERIIKIEQIDELLACSTLQINDVEEVLGVEKFEAKQFLGNMRQCGAIRKHYQYYKKTPDFIKWLKDLRTTLIKDRLLRDAEADKNA